MQYDFRWIDWNIAKVQSHGLDPDDVEHVINRARTFTASGDKRRVTGATPAGKWIQAIYLIDDDDSLFVIHARPLDADEARTARKKP